MSPPVTVSNVTSGSHGSVSFWAPVATLLFNVTSPAGYGVSRVSGPSSPTFLIARWGAFISNSTTLVVHFGPLEPVFFNETIAPGWGGLANGTNWSVSLIAVLANEPRLSVSWNTSTGLGASIGILLPRESRYWFHVHGPESYKMHVAGGGWEIAVPGHAVTRLVKFQFDWVPVTVHEQGLPLNSIWVWGFALWSNWSHVYQNVRTNTSDVLTTYVPPGHWRLDVISTTIFLGGSPYVSNATHRTIWAMPDLAPTNVSITFV